MSALLAYRAAVFEEINCADCGVSFCLLGELVGYRRNDHKAFYCPNGHGNYFPAQSESEKLQKELKLHEARLQAALTRENEERASATKLEKQLNQHKKRTANGVCPCCTRTFKQLAAHMKNKHPEYVNG